MFSHAWGVVSVPWQLWITLGISVWIIYVLDRIIDARRASNPGDLERRHRFHRKYEKAFFAGIAAGAIWCLYSILFLLA